jgi:predicted PP-loop superfamily ATPase
MKALWEALTETSSKATIFVTSPRIGCVKIDQRGINTFTSPGDGTPVLEIDIMHIFNTVSQRYMAEIKIAVLYIGGVHSSASAMRRFIGLCQSYGQEVCTGASVKCKTWENTKVVTSRLNLADMTPKQFKMADEHLCTYPNSVLVSLTITSNDTAMAMPGANRRTFVEKQAQQLLNIYHSFVDRYFDDLSDDAKETHCRLCKRPRLDVKIEQEAP